MDIKNIVVVGGGAAGFFCAIQIAEMHPNWQITIVEKTSKLSPRTTFFKESILSVCHPANDRLVCKKRC